ncbi:MAG: multimeric flavodoxin WrbA [Pseudohongiellaceae bacterium]|jgi:multimeric flavodoxin WrbA
MTSKTLLIIAHIPSPNTLKLKDAVLAGAKSNPLQHTFIKCLSPFDTKPEDILAADAVILGTTENLGYMSGALKDFFDRCYYPCLEVKQGLPCAAYIRAGNDGTGTLNALITITTGLKWRWVQEPIILRGDYDIHFEDQCKELGAAMACALDEGII